MTIRTIFFRIFVFLATAALTPASRVSTSGWTPLYVGIDRASGTVSGSDSSVAIIIVQNGRNISAQGPDEGDPAHPNPRTGVGVSQNGRFLYLVTIDGRQPGYSVGATTSETAQLMLAFGAYNAINLDGGGSTTLVRPNGAGGAIELNRPSGSAERYDANDLGVFGRILNIPEPGMLGLFALGLTGLSLIRPKRV